MATLTFDSHRFVHRLTELGMPERQARALVEELQDITIEQVATKADVQELKMEIQRVKADIFKWAVPLIIGQIVVFIAVNGWMLTFLYPP